MRRLYDPLWFGVAIVLSGVVVGFGWPAFQRTFGFPASLVWTLAAVVGVWLTYVIRAWAWSSREPDGRPKGK